MITEYLCVFLQEIEGDIGGEIDSKVVLLSENTTKFVTDWLVYFRHPPVFGEWFMKTFTDPISW